MNIVQSFKEDGQRIVDNLLQRLRESDDARFKELSSEIEVLLADGNELAPSLCAVAAGGNLEVMQELLNNSAEVDKTDYCGRTALLIASAKGYEECVKLLLEQGADPNKADVDGKVPLVEALIARDTATIKLLWENGATLKNADIGKFLLQAVQEGNTDLIDDYIKYGADINGATDSDGLTALHTAVNGGRMEMVQFLISRGADAHFKSSDEFIPSPCEIAEQYGLFPEIISYLKAQPIRDDTQHSNASNETTNTATKGRHSRKASSVEFQFDNTAPPVSPPNRVATGGAVEKTLHSLMRKQSARGRLMMLKGHRVVRRQLTRNPSTWIPLRRDSTRFNSNQIVPSGAEIAVRVILHPFHPWSKEVTGVGKFVVLPKTLEELLQLTKEKFHNNPTKVLSIEAAEIDDISVIRENDHLYIIDEDKLLTAPQGIDTNDLVANLQAVITALSQSKSQNRADG